MWVAPSTDAAQPSGPTGATGIAIGIWTPGSAPLDIAFPKRRTSRFRSDARAVSSRTGSLSGTAAPESALTSMVAINYRLVASARREDKLVRTMQDYHLPKSQVSEMAKALGGGRGIPHPAVDRRPVDLRGGGTRCYEGPRGRQVGHPRDRLNADCYREVLCASVLIGVRVRWLGSSRICRPRPDWCRPGHLRRGHRADRRDQRHCAGRVPTTLMMAATSEIVVAEHLDGATRGKSHAGRV